MEVFFAFPHEIIDTKADVSGNVGRHWYFLCSFITHYTKRIILTFALRLSFACCTEVKKRKRLAFSSNLPAWIRHHSAELRHTLFIRMRPDAIDTFSVVFWVRCIHRSATPVYSLKNSFKTLITKEFRSLVDTFPVVFRSAFAFPKIFTKCDSVSIHRLLLILFLFFLFFWIIEWNSKNTLENPYLKGFRRLWWYFFCRFGMHSNGMTSIHLIIFT